MRRRYKRAVQIRQDAVEIKRDAHGREWRMGARGRATLPRSGPWPVHRDRQQQHEQHGVPRHLQTELYGRLRRNPSEAGDGADSDPPRQRLIRLPRQSAPNPDEHE